jgi:hypothetical protein
MSDELVVEGLGLEKGTLVIDSAGRPHIVSDQGLNSKKIFYSHRRSTKWETIELYPRGHPAGITTEPHIAAGSTDTAWVGFHTTSSTDRREATVSFLRISHLSRNPQVGPLIESVKGTRTNLKTDQQGRVYVLWRMGTDLFYQLYGAEGTDPSPVRRLTNVKVTIPDEEMGMCSNSFDFDVGRDGIVHGICTNILGLLYSNSTMEAFDKGILMVARGHQVGCEGPYTVPVIQVDRMDPSVVYVLFAGVENKAYVILRAKAGWRKPALLAPKGSDQGSRRAPPFLAAARDGGAICSWMDSRDGRPKVYCRWITGNGRLGPEVEIAVGRHPRFAIDAQGLLHFVYTREGNLYYRVAQAPPRPSKSARTVPVSRP